MTPITPEPPPLSEIGVDDLATLHRGALVLAGGRETGWHRSALYDILAYAMKPGDLIPVVRAAELPPESWVAHVGLYGAPSIVDEKLPDGTELAGAAQLVADRQGVRLSAVANVEAGGINMFGGPLTAHELGIAALDGDMMGRNAQHFNQMILSAGGLPPGRVAFHDNQNNKVLLETNDINVVDSVGDAIAIAFGGWTAVGCYLVQAGELARRGITGSLSRARMIGEALTLPLRGSVAEVITRIGGDLLFHGTLIELSSSVLAQEPWAIVIDDGDHIARVDAEQEYLVCAVDGEVVATVPDIIFLLTDSGELIDVEKLRLGLPVSVGRLRSDHKWGDPRLSRLMGPRAFGIDLDPLLPP